MSKSRFIKLGLILIIVFLTISYHRLGWGDQLSFASLKSNQEHLSALFTANPIAFGGLFVLTYILATALSLPGATILTLGSGAIFGLGLGLALVSVASSVGATLAFLGSRFLFASVVKTRFGSRLEAIHRGLEKEGVFYLFTLRLVPIFPFFLINLLMGLTPIKVLPYFIVSMVGMLPGTFVYVNAGTQLSKINTAEGIFSPSLLLSFALVGILPILTKAVITSYKSRQNLLRFRRPRSFDFNLLVLGGGSAGLVSAYIAAAVKAKVGLIEKNKMGGDCLNTGCVPSKTLIHSAKVFYGIKQAHKFGIDASPPLLDFAKVMARVQKVILDIAPHDSMERYRSLGVDCFQGQAKIVSPYEVEVNGQRLTTQNLVIATGASPYIPDLPGLSETPFLTSENLWQLRTLPQKLVILGGGPIGCELAQAFQRFGSQVQLIEMSSRILSREDTEVSAFIEERFKLEGMSVLTRHRAQRIEAQNGQYQLFCEHEGQELSIPFDHILLALGRKANVTGFGLEDLGFELNPEGTLATDEFLRSTKFPNVYACGDVTGPFQFTHTASHQAWYVAVNALFSPFKTFKVDYRVIPWCTFTDPEVARVGINEQEALAKKN